ncbi:MAG: hypothetical protein RIF32_23645 [Leptospirales bacterium]|jgi:hypothetical protein
MKLKHDNYSAEIIGGDTVRLSGVFRLQGKEQYLEVLTLLESAIESASGSLIIDLTDLSFLNSSGVSSLSIFVIQAREAGHKNIKIIGSNKYSWQTKSLKNFQKLWKNIEVEVREQPAESSM